MMTLLLYRVKIDCEVCNRWYSTYTRISSERESVRLGCFYCRNSVRAIVPRYSGVFYAREIVTQELAISGYIELM